MRIFALCVEERETLAGLQEQLGDGVTLLADPDASAVDAFGMRDKDPFPPRTMARAGTFYLDRAGTIAHRWLPGSYHERPDPDGILALIR